MKKTIYISIDGVAAGPMDIDDSKQLLTEIRNKYPDAQRAKPYEEGSNVIIVTTKNDGA